MSIEDFSLKVEGFYDARIWEERCLRRLGQVLQAPHVTKEAPSMLRQWPIAKDEETRVKAKDKTDKDNMNAADKIIKEGEPESQARAEFNNLKRFFKTYNDVIKKPQQLGT